MKRLVIDTCFAACSAALITSEHAAAACEPMARGHAEALMPMIAKVMAELDTDFAALDEIVVTTGPGTFTGMRVGIAAARALALAGNVALSRISSLQLMALGARRQIMGGARRQLDDDLAASSIAVAVDARKEQIYMQCFDAQLKAMAPPKVISPAQALQYLPKGRVIAVGNGAASLLAAWRHASSGCPEAAGDTALKPRPEYGSDGNANRSSGIDLQLALPGLQPDARDLGQHPADAAPSAQTIRPLYLRPADAKPQTGKSIARAR